MHTCIIPVLNMHFSTPNDLPLSPKAAAIIAIYTVLGSPTKALPPEVASREETAAAA